MPGRKKKNQFILIGVIFFFICTFILLYIMHENPSYSGRGFFSPVSRCMDHVRQIVWASLIYSQSYDDNLPNDIELLKTEGILTDENSYLCPISEKPYFLLNGLNARMSPTMPVLVEFPDDHKRGRGIVVGYISGEAKEISLPVIMLSYRALFPYLNQGLTDEESAHLKAELQRLDQAHRNDDAEEPADKNWTIF